ncbi:MAG: hypothetical protein IJY35_03155, partial [Clostridia bacterium]|nr:hypothetical protein [Clostridia bacterium]
GVRVKKTVTDGAELYFLHNRTDAARTFEILLDGEFTRCSMAMDVTDFVSCGAFDVTVPAKDAVMLIRWKN